MQNGVILMRNVIALNSDWVLVKENESINVSLPHSFNEADGQGEGKMCRGD